MVAKRCILDETKKCDDCGECNRCDLDPSKTCNNCLKCLQISDADYQSIMIEDVQETDPEYSVLLKTFLSEKDQGNYQ